MANNSKFMTMDEVRNLSQTQKIMDIAYVLKELDLSSAYALVGEFPKNTLSALHLYQYLDKQNHFQVLVPSCKVAQPLLLPYLKTIEISQFNIYDMVDNEGLRILDRLIQIDNIRGLQYDSNNSSLVYELFKHVISKTSDINSACGHSGHTPLHRAALQSNLGVFKMLVKAGANPDILHKNGKSCDDYAVFEPTNKTTSPLLPHQAKLRDEHAQVFYEAYREYRLQYGLRNEHTTNKPGIRL